MSAKPDTKIKAVMHIALPPILDIVTYSAFISESLIDENIEGRPDLVTLYKSFQDIHHALDNDIKYENKNIDKQSQEWKDIVQDLNTQLDKFKVSLHEVQSKIDEMLREGSVVLTRIENWVNAVCEILHNCILKANLDGVGQNEVLYIATIPEFGLNGYYGI